jgi:hypothetical protein
MPEPRSVSRPTLLLAILPVLLAGCALTFDARSLGVPATMAGPPVAAAPADSFRVTQTAIHLFWGLYEARGASLQNALAGQLADGRGVANLRIRTHRRWSDVLGAALSLGLVMPTSVTFEGVVTRREP